MHPEYGPGNWKGSGRDIACTDPDDCAAPPPLAQEAKAKNKNVLEFSHDLKVRFRFKKLRQKDYATEKLYLLQSIKRCVCVCVCLVSVSPDHVLHADSSIDQCQVHHQD
jgi:hypothetical protein